MISVIAIDDEHHANEHFKKCCLQIPFVKLIDTFTDPFQALPILNSAQIDLLFLDFHMGPISAPEFMTYVPSSVKVVIVSSEMKYKIEAYNMKIMGIIHKPYPCESILEICKKVIG